MVLDNYLEACFGIDEDVVVDGENVLDQEEVPDHILEAVEAEMEAATLMEVKVDWRQCCSCRLGF